MKIAIATALYRDALHWFYHQHSTIGSMSFQDHKVLFDEKVSLWTAAWNRALTKQGHEVLSIPLNADLLLTTWAQDQGLPSNSSQTIVVELLKQFQPDIIWFDSVHAQLLKEIKSNVPSIRLTIGWSGSAIVAFDVFKETNIIFSCAPETVEILSAQGYPVFHLHHAFDSAWLQQISSAKKLYSLSFVGQFVRGQAFHTVREKLLKQLADNVDLEIFSPTYEMGIPDILKTLLVQIAYLSLFPLKKTGISSSLLGIPSIRKVLELTHVPQMPYDAKLKRLMSPAVFGSGMLECLANSRIVLNVHADSSPHYASNMRLFETTGVGTLLLTEWRKNISELFDPEREIATYNSNEECVEKARWFLSHPTECASIALQGQKRTLQDHTFDHRAGQFLSIIQKHL